MVFRSFQYQELLDQRSADSLMRHRRSIEGAQGVELYIEGGYFLNFCSNDYLGLASDPRIRQAFKQAVDQYGVGSGASHYVCGHFSVHQALEESLADWLGRPKALLFSCGYMANLGVIQALLGRHDYLFEDRLNHASLIDGGLLSGAKLKRYPHLDVNVLQKQLADVEPSEVEGRALIATDALFSMDGDYAPLEKLTHLASRYNASLFVDEAHALGVMGQAGAGLVSELGLGVDQVPFIMGTLGKALGCSGAFVAGEETQIEFLIQKARTSIYTTALPPANCAAALASVEIVKQAKSLREKLLERIGYFKHCALEVGLPLLSSDSAIQLLMIGDAERALKLSHRLYKRGILVTAIRPPTVPKQSARLRITLSAQHTRSMIDNLIEALVSIFEETDQGVE